MLSLENLQQSKTELLSTPLPLLVPLSGNLPETLQKRPAPKPPTGVSHPSSFYSTRYSSHSRTPSDPMLGPSPYHPGLPHNNNNNNSGGGGSLGGMGHKRSPSTDSSNSVFYPQPSSSSNTTTTSSGATRFSLSHNLPPEAKSGEGTGCFSSLASFSLHRLGSF